MTGTPTAPSALLLLAIGREQLSHDNQTIFAIWSVAEDAGVPLHEIETLLAKGMEAGYIEEDDEFCVGLTAKGWAWFETHDEAAP